MGETNDYIKDLQRNFDDLRSNVVGFDTHGVPGGRLIVGTICAVIFSFSFIMPYLVKDTKKARLTSTPLRSSTDYCGQLASDACAFIVFPVFVVMTCDQLISSGKKVYEGSKRYPAIHRFLGYLYYTMVPIMSVGLGMIALKPNSGFPTQVAILLFLPPWVLCNIAAFRAIAFFKDVELHRQLNIIGLSFAAQIIVMRPLTAVFLLWDLTMPFQGALGLTMWAGFVGQVIVTAAYVTIAYTLPTMRFPRLQQSGKLSITGSAHCPLEDMITDAVSITSFKLLDARTVILRVSTHGFHTNEGDDYRPVFPIDLLPGCHVSLKLGDLVREFTPINTNAASDIHSSEMEVAVRLVKGGAFSTLLSSTLGVQEAVSDSTEQEWKKCSHPCGIYGPLLPLPSKFGYCPSYSLGKISESFSTPPTLIMIGGGTGAMPFFGIIEAALKNKNDKTLLRLLSLSGTNKEKENHPNTKYDFGAFIATKIEEVQLSTNSLSENHPGRNRFIGTNTRSKFDVSMLESWIRYPSVPARTGPSAVRTCGTDNMVVWICGPPGFGESCRSALTKTSVETKAKGLFHSDQIFVLGVDDR